MKTHSLIKTMISVNDMFLTSFSRASNFFFEDVEKFLTINEVRFVPNIQFSGVSHYFDFLFLNPRNNQKY